jgi:hypothetical protein
VLHRAFFDFEKRTIEQDGSSWVTIMGHSIVAYRYPSGPIVLDTSSTMGHDMLFDFQLLISGFPIVLHRDL